ncbi:hypothetical protein Bhz55_00099 [Stenotrophomonas phage vB_SmaS_Bhz55]
MTTERPRFILQIAVSPFGERVGWAAHVIGTDSTACRAMMVDLLNKMKLPHEFGVVHDIAVSVANTGSAKGVMANAEWLGNYMSVTEKSGLLVNLTTEMIR